MLAAFEPHERDHMLQRLQRRRGHGVPLMFAKLTAAIPLLLVLSVSARAASWTLGDSLPPPGGYGSYSSNNVNYARLKFVAPGRPRVVSPTAGATGAWSISYGVAYEQTTSPFTVGKNRVDLVVTRGFLTFGTPYSACFSLHYDDGTGHQVDVINYECATAYPGD